MCSDVFIACGTARAWISMSSCYEENLQTVVKFGLHSQLHAGMFRLFFSHLSWNAWLCSDTLSSLSWFCWSLSTSLFVFLLHFSLLIGYLVLLSVTDSQFCMVYIIHCMYIKSVIDLAFCLRPLATCLKMTNFPPNGHFQACRKRPKCITGTDFSAPNHHVGPQQWSRWLRTKSIILKPFFNMICTI